jgi:hypothetical protein
VSGPGGSRTLEPPLRLPHLPLRRGRFAELSAIRPTVPGQGVEPRSPRSERGVLPVRRSRIVHPISQPCCLCHSPTLRPWIDRTAPCEEAIPASDVEELWSPALLRSAEKAQAKARGLSQPVFPCLSTEGPFSLGRGLILDQRFLKLSIVLSSGCDSSPETTRATRLGRPRLELLSR